MQASKIKVKEVYAIRISGELKRFRVTAVVQRRIDNTGSPHDYKSWVEGVVVEDRIEGLPSHEQKVINLSPDEILGPYQEYEELLQRSKAEDAAKQAKADAAKAANLELRALLYQLIDEPVPDDPTSYRQPFRYMAGAVDLSSAAVVPLLNALKTRIQPK